MKRKLLFAIVAMLLGGLGEVMADEVKQEITSLITNPTFDSNIDGWTNSNFEYHAANDKQYSTGFAQIWSASVRSGSISQILSNLPKGTYQLTANCVGGTNEGSGYDYLYAANASSEKLATVDVEWVSGDLANLRTLNFTNPSTQNVTIGFVANATKWWSAIDNIQLYGVDLAAAAYSLPSTAVTAGTWYKFTTGSSSDVYTLSSTGNATITYTTDGTLEDDSGISDTWSLTATQNVLLAPSTTYYIKSSAPVTLSKKEYTSSYVSGWTKVTSISDLQTNPEDYFFAIFSANNVGLMMRTDNSSGSPYYITAATPLGSSEYLYEIGNYTYSDNSYFVLKSCGTGAYYYPVSDQAYNLQAPSSGKTTADDACRLTFEVANDVWNIKTWAVYDNGSYLGMWTPTKSYATGERLAGNKTDAAKGSFLIYRIAKHDLDVTSLITNPDFSDPTWSTGWSGTGNDKAKAFKGNTNSSFTGTMAEMWVKSGKTMSAGDLYQTLSKLPAGVYELSAKIQAGVACTLYASIDDEVQSITYTGSVATQTLTFTVSSVSDVKIGLKHSGVTSASADTWVAVDDFTLSYEPFADADDYTDLNTAIAAAEAKTLGFDNGEFAPYNNVAALTALATAKAIDQTAKNAQETVQAATTALTSATWTANNGEVNAVYDGTLANAPIQATSENVVLPGWVTKSGNIRQTFKGTGEDGKACLADAIDQVGVFVHPGTYNYGETTGYTMPLNAGQTYVVEAKYCSWADDSNRYFNLTILKDGKTIATSNNGSHSAACTESGALKTVRFYFDASEAGDYVLSVNISGNTFMTDFIIKKAAKMTVKANKYGTFIAPFAVTIPENVSAYTVTGVNTTTNNVQMAEVETTIPANTPVILYNNTESLISQNCSVSGATYASNTETSYTEGLLTGVYTASTIAASANNYVLQTQNDVQAFYSVNSAFTATPNRCYLTYSGASVKAFGFDFGGATAIKNIDADNMKDATIFNLAGQRVNKAQKGIYIVNGKKVLVK